MKPIGVVVGCATIGAALVSPQLLLASPPPASRGIDAHASRLVQESLGCKAGSGGFRPVADVNGDGVVNILDVARQLLDDRGIADTDVARQTALTEVIRTEQPVASAAPGGSVSVKFLLDPNTFALLGYSLDVVVVPDPSSVGTVTVDMAATNFFEKHNLITACEACPTQPALDPDFSLIINTGDGSVFVNAITSDLSTVIAEQGVNDVFAEVVFNASPDACGRFEIQLDAGTALADENASSVPFTFTPGVIAVRPVTPESDFIPDDQGQLQVSAKNRSLSFENTATGTNQAVRVTFQDLAPPFDVMNNVEMWVGVPFDVSELSGKDDTTPPTFKSASLQCDPFFMDWSTVGLVHVFHEGIVPNSVYAVQSINSGCALDAEEAFSEALLLPTSRWRDAVGVFDGGAGLWTAPNGTVDVTFDVVAILDKFKNAPTAPIKARADIQPEPVDFKITIVDVTRALDAFAGQQFPFVPGSVPCAD